MSPLDRLLLAVLPAMPNGLMRRLAARYIAGETLADALARLELLRSQGHPGILDILGEDVLDEQQAQLVARAYAEAAQALAARRLDCYVSVKPTHFGLRLSQESCAQRYAALAAHCAALGLFVRVEMEDHATTDGTLAVFERLRAAHANVGIVLQSRLKRTPQDIERLAPGALRVRMVKGIYLEPAEIAHTEPEPIRDAFVACSRKLFERGASISFATHDELLAERLLALVRELGVERERYEFQVLLGVREALWSQWRAQGHVVRVYVPYGPEWRPYSLRRMRKNPQILRHVVRASLRPSRGLR